MFFQFRQLPKRMQYYFISWQYIQCPSVNNLAALNNAYSQFCVPKCIDPIISYCRFTYTGDYLTYLINLLRHGVCGKHNNDFCEVLYLRRYANNRNFINVLINACPFTNSGVHCARASSTCKQYVSNFNTNMGCCTSPYLGSDVSSCGINVADPCQSVLTSPTIPGSDGIVSAQTSSSYGPIAPAMFFILIAVFSTFFI